ncbi:hypothetical protein K439DRAFT_1072616 [Ramaria rubella]|nr:hypothetical protein K439DRAFT_1072616 [Ramaria rubella]
MSISNMCWAVGGVTSYMTKFNHLFLPRSLVSTLQNYIQRCDICRLHIFHIFTALFSQNFAVHFWGISWWKFILIYPQSTRTISITRGSPDKLLIFQWTLLVHEAIKLNVPHGVTS